MPVAAGGGMGAGGLGMSMLGGGMGAAEMGMGGPGAAAAGEGDEDDDEEEENAPRRKCTLRWVIDGPGSGLALTAVVANTVVLALDQYPANVR